ncbi:MAG TPA: carbohydrate binding domain-containing protein, partial [Mariniphaga sp.]|nr:carbohydrate binding domain-containing protein [Mariniphaga sp.]
YMPLDSYSFGTPYPSGTNSEARIDNGHYAVVSPLYIKDGWDPNDLSNYFWTPGMLDDIIAEAGAVTDISGTARGALLAVNTNDNLDVFYKREVTVEHDETYRASFWMYLLEGPAKIAIDIKEKSTGKLLGTYTTETFSNTSSAKNKWSNVQLYFKVPPVEDIHCTIEDVYLEIRNDLEDSSGSRFYIDNIGLTSLGSQCPMPADPLDIECPPKPLILTNPMLINQAKK